MADKTETLQTQTHIVLGTAGHIDHGKTSLVQSLTGTNPDRLKEEIERGMTIDLGFAFLGENITIIDVPGHEKFVKTMVAGVNTIDIALLVIAADDGIMPQTREHLEILNLLAIGRGLIALTKIDIVEPGWAEMVADDIRELVKGTFLEHAPIVPVSNITHAGVDELKNEIIRIGTEVRARRDKGVFRLLIDRAFSIKGFGTVVAGTVLSGKVAPEDTVELLPQGIQLRVRGVQVHEKSVAEGKIGFRTAINIGGIEKDLVERGNVLVEPGYYKPARMIDASFQLLKSWGKPLANRTRLRVHIGTSEIIARAVLLDKKEFLPGDEGFIQFHFEAPVVADIGDRFVVRSYSPLRTMGGGVILDTRPVKHKPLEQEVVERLKRLVKGDPNQVVLELFNKDRFVPKSAEDIAKALGITKEELENRLALMEQNLQIIRIGKKRFMSTVNLEALKAKIVSIVEAFHNEDPLHFALASGKLCLLVKPAVDRLLFDEILDEYRKNGVFIIDGDQVRLASRKISLSEKQQEYLNQIENAFLKDPYNPPGFEEILEKMGEKVHKLLQYMVETGMLVQIERGVYFHTKALADAKGKIVRLFGEKKEAAIGDMKELFESTSRKKLVMMLEYFDRIGLTVRDGEVRKLK